MVREAGSRSARMAWGALRGPYLVSYFALLMYVTSVRFEEQFASGWRVASIAATSVLIIGSVCSYAVVAKWPGNRWRRGERWEYSGLWVTAALEVMHAAWAAFSLHSVIVMWAHLAIASLLLGQAMSMGWNRGESRG